MIDSKPTQLDDMLSRAYSTKNYAQFAKLAKRKLQRLKKVKLENV